MEQEMRGGLFEARGTARSHSVSCLHLQQEHSSCTVWRWVSFGALHSFW